MSNKHHFSETRTGQDSASVNEQVQELKYCDSQREEAHETVQQRTHQPGAGISNKNPENQTSGRKEGGMQQARAPAASPTTATASSAPSRSDFPGVQTNDTGVSNPYLDSAVSKNASSNPQPQSINPPHAPFTSRPVTSTHQPHRIFGGPRDRKIDPKCKEDPARYPDFLEDKKEDEKLSTYRFKGSSS